MSALLRQAAIVQWPSVSCRALSFRGPGAFLVMGGRGGMHTLGGRGGQRGGTGIIWRYSRPLVWEVKGWEGGDGDGAEGPWAGGRRRRTVVRWSSSSSKASFPKEEEEDKNEEDKQAQQPASPPRSATAAAAAPAKKRWGLREFTIFASFICAIDCTVFPVLLTVLPAAEMLTPDNAQLIHHASHLAALYVVLPIGTTTTVTNYILHRNAPLAALSTLGLSLILGSNADFSFLPSFFHESRALNTLGCGMLIGSSYLGHRGGDDHDHHDKEGGAKQRAPSCHGPPPPSIVEQRQEHGAGIHDDGGSKGTDHHQHQEKGRG